jgi:hypothetical protein
MGTKNNPAPNDCYAKAEPDEPMFILLARDPAAPGMVRRWAAHRAMDPGTPPEQVAEALQCAAEMEAWYTKRLEERRPTVAELELILQAAPEPDE